MKRSLARRLRRLANRLDGGQPLKVEIVPPTAAEVDQVVRAIRNHQRRKGIPSQNRLA